MLAIKILKNMQNYNIFQTKTLFVLRVSNWNQLMYYSLRSMRYLISFIDIVLSQFSMFLKYLWPLFMGPGEPIFNSFFCKARDLLETMKFVKKQGLNYQLLKTADIGKNWKWKQLLSPFFFTMWKISNVWLKTWKVDLHIFFTTFTCEKKAANQLFSSKSHYRKQGRR